MEPESDVARRQLSRSFVPFDRSIVIATMGRDDRLELIERRRPYRLTALRVSDLVRKLRQRRGSKLVSTELEQDSDPLQPWSDSPRIELDGVPQPHFGCVWVALIPRFFSQMKQSEGRRRRILPLSVQVVGSSAQHETGSGEQDPKRSRGDWDRRHRPAKIGNRRRPPQAT